MKARMKHILRRSRELLNTSDHFSFFPNSLLREQTNNKASQINLLQTYRSVLLSNRKAMIDFKDSGFRQFSQTDEDGRLLYIFAVIGSTNRKCIEICVADGSQCNTLNLIMNHGWWGLLFDGSAEKLAKANSYYAANLDTCIYPPRIMQAWVSAENVNDLIKQGGYEGPIDLLSIDIDGNDYWVWKAISIVKPRVVVIEYHNPVPPDLALTIPYDPKFEIKSFEDDFRGGSLRAMVNLGKTMGYRLVGTNHTGFNAFFILGDEGSDVLPEVTPESCAQDPYTIEAQKSRWPKVSEKPWVAV